MKLEPELEWDEAKRQSNLTKHQLDFVDARQLFREGFRPYEYGSPRGQETRFVRVGEVAGQMVAVIWTPRGSVVRIISMRIARDDEVGKYRALHT